MANDNKVEAVNNVAITDDVKLVVEKVPKVEKSLEIIPLKTPTPQVAVNQAVNPQVAAVNQAVTPQVSAPVQPQVKSIEIDLPTSSRIKILSTATGESNQLIVNNGKISLTKGQHYTIPIKNKSLNLDNSYFAKVFKDLRNHIQILDVSEGSVTVAPLVHNTIIKDGDLIGSIL